MYTVLYCTVCESTVTLDLLEKGGPGSRTYVRRSLPAISYHTG